MHDIREMRNHADLFIATFEKRGLLQAKLLVELILEKDAARRQLQKKIDDLLCERNQITREVAVLKSQGNEPEDMIQKVVSLKITRDALVEEEEKVAGELQSLLLSLPNMILDSVPVGSSEQDNKEVRRVGNTESQQENLRNHVDVGSECGLWIERATAISGARFYLSLGDLASLERAIVNFMLDLHTQEHGFCEASVPHLVKADALVGTGQLPKFEEDLFCTKEGYYLIPTAEVPLTNLAANSVWSDVLPKRFVAYTPCYRSEAGSGGRDVRGLIRLHQFSKVELVSFTQEGEGEKELDYLVHCAEKVLQLLEIPYRVVLLCTGDMGFSSKKTYDIEVWLASFGGYREISSCSYCGDFQARRMSAYYLTSEKKKKYLHTLNASGLAVQRLLAAILENYQDSEGGVKVPGVLIPYLKKEKIGLYECAF